MVVFRIWVFKNVVNFKIFILVSYEFIIRKKIIKINLEFNYIYKNKFIIIFLISMYGCIFLFLKKVCIILR